MPSKKPAKPGPPVRSLDDLLAESKRLEQRGKELIEQVRALASEVAEAKAKSQDGRAKRQ